VDRAIVDRPDGTRIDYKNDQLLQTTTTKITNPDGSSTSSEDTPHYLSSMKTDANGFWEMSVFSKDSGVATQFKGTPGQDPNQGEASSRMQTVPI